MSAPAALGKQEVAEKLDESLLPALPVKSDDGHIITFA